MKTREKAEGVWGMLRLWVQSPCDPAVILPCIENRGWYVDYEFFSKMNGLMRVGLFLALPFVLWLYSGDIWFVLSKLNKVAFHIDFPHFDKMIPVTFIGGCQWRTGP